MDNQKYEERLERIERFLRNQMSREEEKAFMKDMKTDKELREDARLMALTTKALNDQRKREEQHIVRMARHINRIERERPAISSSNDCLGSYDEAEYEANPVRFSMKPSEVHDCDMDVDKELPVKRKLARLREARMQLERKERAEGKIEILDDIDPPTRTNSIPTELPQKRKSSLNRFMKWALPIAAMVVLVFGIIKLTNNNSSQKELAQNNVVVNHKQPENGNEEIFTPEMEVENVDESSAPAEAPAEKDITMYGGTLPDVGAATDTNPETLLATIDKAIEEEENLTPFINEMQDILNGIKTGKEEYAQFKPLKEKIDWRLAAALAIDGDGCMAKDVLDDLANEDNVLAEMLRKQYQCSE